MSNFLVLAVIAVIGGAVVTLQAQFIGLMDQKMGTVESVFFTYAIGGVMIAVVLAILRGGNLAAWRNVPWYALTSGLAGLVIIAALSYTVPRLGIVTAFTIFVASQFLVGALFDHFGLLGATVRPLDISRLLGVAVLLLGVWLIIR